MKLHFKEPHAEVISTKLGTKYHLIKSAQVCLNSGPVPLSLERNRKYTSTGSENRL